MTTMAVPTEVGEPTNQRILQISEDRVAGFQRDPFGCIARESGVPIETVLERVKAMLEAGVIRRVRQTLMATNLAPGALAAWQVPQERLHEAFDDLFQNDPFSGHVVIRTTDAETPGSAYRLWTTLKVPQGFAIEKHAAYLADRIGASGYRLMAAKCLFALGVGHMRRRTIAPGDKTESLAKVTNTGVVALSSIEWRVLEALKRELAPEEVVRDVWRQRAEEAGVSFEEFCTVAETLNARGVIGRFSTFLEHVKELSTGERVTRYNALFHWAVPPGREVEAGREVGRHHILTHAYWREGGREFANVNIMAVAHGMEKPAVLAHKAAIDAHLAECGIPVSYTNVFWGGRSEIKPSEISPLAYGRWCTANGIDPESMRPEVN